MAKPISSLVVPNHENQTSWPFVASNFAKYASLSPPVVAPGLLFLSLPAGIKASPLSENPVIYTYSEDPSFEYSIPQISSVLEPPI